MIKQMLAVHFPPISC